MTRKSILFVQVGKAELVDIPLPELKTNEDTGAYQLFLLYKQRYGTRYLCSGDLNVSPMQPTLRLPITRSSGYSTSGTVEP